MISRVGYSVEEVIDDYSNGYSVVEIANKYATTSSIIRKLLKDNGVIVKKVSSDEFDQSVVSEFKEGKTVNDISKKFEVSAKSVRRILKKNDLNADPVEIEGNNGCLTKSDYSNIRALADKGYSVEQIGEMYNFDNIKAGRVYRQALKSFNLSISDEKKTKSVPKKDDTKKTRSVSKEEEDKIKQLLLEGKSKYSITAETGRSYNVVTRIEKELGLSKSEVKSSTKDDIKTKSKSTKKTKSKSESTKKTKSKTKSKSKDLIENHNPYFKSYEEKKEYLDGLYKEGRWKILSRSEFSRLFTRGSSLSEPDYLLSDDSDMTTFVVSDLDIYKNMFFDI